MKYLLVAILAVLYVTGIAVAFSTWVGAGDFDWDDED